MFHDRFDAEFVKIPFHVDGNVYAHLDAQYADAIKQTAHNLADTCQPFTIGDIPAGIMLYAYKGVDGASVLRLASSLVTQIQTGGSRYNLVSATEALVTSMARYACMN